ncbi:competence protein [Clostridium sp. CAG:557]|nr:competence protein [Clostridium sp. CAG:557]
MKRPMATVGFTYLAALVAATYFNADFAKIMSIIFFVLFIISLVIKSIRKQKVLPIAFFTVTVAFAVYSVFNYVNVKPIEQLNEQDAVISGKICELPYSAYNRCYYVVETDKIDLDGAPQKIKLRISMSKALDADLYDKISGKVHMSLPSDSGGFSSKTYYAAKGIHMLSYLYEYEDYQIKSDENKPIYYYFLKAKQTLIESIRTLLPKEQASVAVGVLLGDKNLMDDEIKSNFKAIGISHLLAVSGLHASVIATAIFALLQMTKLSKKWVSLLTCVAIVCFMALTGFSASVTRAGIMLIMFYLSKFFYVKSDSLNSLGLATFVITMFNPFAAGDLGLLMSVLSTLGIILFEDKFEAKIKNLAKNLKCGSKVLDKLAGTISVTLCATIMTMPIIMLSFGKVSLINVISNILIVFPTMLMMIFTLIFSVLYLIPFFKFIAIPLAFLAGLLINYIIFCANLLAKIPFASVSTRQPMVLFWLAVTCILIALALFLYEKYKLLKLSAILSTIILFIGIFSYQIFDRDITHLAFLDTGNGCSAVISQNGHTSVLSCGGDKFKLSKMQNYLDAQNVKNLDYLILSDFQDSTANYANDVIKKFNPNYVVLPSSTESIDEKLERNISDSSNAVYFSKSVEVNCWDNLKIKSLNFDDHGYIYLTVNDVNILINPSGGNAQVLPDEYKFCDFLVSNGTLENSDLILSAYEITTADLDISSKAATESAKNNRLPLATAGDGDIVLDLKNGKNISIKRMI